MTARSNRKLEDGEALAYIGDMSSSLARLARQNKLATLSYLLQLAQMEAEQTAGKTAATEKMEAAAAIDAVPEKPDAATGTADA